KRAQEDDGDPWPAAAELAKRREDEGERDDMGLEKADRERDPGRRWPAREERGGDPERREEDPAELGVEDRGPERQRRDDDERERRAAIRMPGRAREGPRSDRHAREKEHLPRDGRGQAEPGERDERERGPERIPEAAWTRGRPRYATVIGEGPGRRHRPRPGVVGIASCSHQARCSEETEQVRRRVGTCRGEREERGDD